MGILTAFAAEITTGAETVQKFRSGFEDIAKDASFGERAAYGFKVMIIGMLIVFLVLLLLWGICALLGVTVGRIGQKKDEKENAGKTAPLKTENVVSGNVQAKNAVPAADYSVVAAVASAAIAAYRGEDNVGFEIRSIRPLGAGNVALNGETVAQIAAAIASVEGKDRVDFEIVSVRAV